MPQYEKTKFFELLSEQSKNKTVMTTQQQFHLEDDPDNSFHNNILDPLAYQRAQQQQKKLQANFEPLRNGSGTEDAVQFTNL